MSAAIIAISLGEPAGIGPDLVVIAAQTARALPWIVFGAAAVLMERAEQLGLPLQLEPYYAGQTPTHQAGRLTIVDCPCVAEVKAGQLDKRNAPAVLHALSQAARFCAEQKGRALVTLPIHKGIINATGIAFTGHTEYLADLSGVAKVVMMLGSARLKVALQTIHVPLKKVPELITPAELLSTLQIIDRHWRRYYHKKPRVLVLGVNPHAGEDGYLGTEEIDVIQPTLARLKAEGYEVLGPVAADTAFAAQPLAKIDVVLAMYHDQGLAPLKALEFGAVVNYTLGLPYIRTSVDHGVALDVAGHKGANGQSFMTAVAAAEQLLHSHHQEINHGD